MNDYAIEARQVSKSYGPVLALDKVSLHVKTGSIYGLVGDNGAGKSTFLKLLAGHVFPTSGEIRLFGQFEEKELLRCRRQTGVMIEHPGYFPNMTVENTLEYYRIQKGIPGKEKAEEMLHLTKLWEKRKSRCKKLSLGQKQRLAMACATLHRPSVLFLDEPTSGVDPRTRREFWKHINAMTQNGVAVLVTTHFMEEAEYCDEIALIFQGGVIARGTPDDLKAKAPRTEKTEERAEDMTLEDAFIAYIEAVGRKGGAA